MTVVKVQCVNGDIYRLTLKESKEEPSFEAILELVANGCNVKTSTLREGYLKYADDEGDLCTLAPATFQDFMEVQKAHKQLLKLRLMLPVQNLSTFCLPEEERQLPDLKMPCDVPSTDPPGPPGLEKDENGPGGGGPRRLLLALHMLLESQMLTPAMFASLTVQWLPLLTQRVARKVDKINHMARHGFDQTVQKMLEKIQEQAAKTPGLEHFAAPIAEALSGNGADRRRLGESILELLKAIRGLGFEIQTHFCESLASTLVPYLENLIGTYFGHDCSFYACDASEQLHAGTKCSGCGAEPIPGPRFKCPTCPEYDLCGNCYPQKKKLHGDCPGCSKDFQCIIFPPKGGNKANDLEPLGAKGGWMDAAMCLGDNPVTSILAQEFGAGTFGFPFPAWPMPCVGMDFTEAQENSWPCWPKGQGKGRKGKRRKG